MVRRFKSFFDTDGPLETIADIWNTIPKVVIGHGRYSVAYLATLGPDEKYIVRITPVVGSQERQLLLHEIEIYQRLKKTYGFSNYVSDLVYADVPTLYHNKQNYDNSYFVFRYAEGLPLDTLIQTFHRQSDKKTYMTIDAVQKWTRNLLEILDFLKANKIIHRDIKPANLFVDTTHDRLLIFDFGSACFEGHDCKSYEFHGTRNYAAPNTFQLFTHFPKVYEYTPVNDLYSVKVIVSKDIMSIVSPNSIGTYRDYLHEHHLWI